MRVDELLKIENGQYTDTRRKRKNPDCACAEGEATAHSPWLKNKNRLQGGFLDQFGRGERIRTSDSCVPNAVLYQAELHPELELIMQSIFKNQ